MPPNYYFGTPVMASDYTVDVSNAPVDGSSGAVINWLVSQEGGTTQNIPDNQRNTINIVAMGHALWHPPGTPDPCTGKEPCGPNPIITCDCTGGGKYLLNVPAGTKLVAVQFDTDGGTGRGAPDISDGWDPNTGKSFPYYPIPDWAQMLQHCIQDGWPANVFPTPHPSDRHMQIFVAATANTPPMLYELINVHYGPNDGNWHAFAGSGRAVDTLEHLHSGTLPGPNLAAFESTAGGMPMSGGMIFYDEVVNTTSEINHGFRAVFRATKTATDIFRDGFVYPCHRTQSKFQDNSAMPMGARFRLKSAGRPGGDLVEAKIAQYPPQAQRLLRGFQKYGVIHNDVGFGDFGIEGTFDPRWDDVPDGLPYPTGNDPTRGMGRGLLEDLRFGANGNQNNIIRNSDWEMIQLGYKP